jgi:hypothetical protein
MADSYDDLALWWRQPVNTLGGQVGPAPTPHVPQQSPSERGVSRWLRSYGVPGTVADVGGAAASLTPFGGAYDAGQAFAEYPGWLTGAGLTLAALPFGARAPVRALPMDATSVAARRRAMGYTETPFYRGDAGNLSEYPSGGFFSRDPDLAAGHAARYQGDATAVPREFRLNLQSSFSFNRPLTGEQRDRLVSAVAAENPRLADDLAGAIDDGTPTAFIWQALERGTGNPRETLRRAGFTAVDTGRDVMMLSGSGIRSADAAFDPARAHLPNIYYGLPFATLASLAAAPVDER